MNKEIDETIWNSNKLCLSFFFSSSPFQFPGHHINRKEHGSSGAALAFITMYSYR